MPVFEHHCTIPAKSCIDLTDPEVFYPSLIMFNHKVRPPRALSLTIRATNILVVVDPLLQKGNGKCVKLGLLKLEMGHSRAINLPLVALKAFEEGSKPLYLSTIVEQYPEVPGPGPRLAFRRFLGVSL